MEKKWRNDKQGLVYLGSWQADSLVIALTLWKSDCPMDPMDPSD